MHVHLYVLIGPYIFVNNLGSRLHSVEKSTSQSIFGKDRPATIKMTKYNVDTTGEDIVKDLGTHAAGKTSAVP